MSKIEVVVKGPYHRMPNFNKKHPTKCWCFGMPLISYEAGIRLRVHVGSATREQLAELWLHQIGTITETIKLKDGPCDVVTTPINERFALGKGPSKAGQSFVGFFDVHTTAYLRNIEKCDDCCVNEMSATVTLNVVTVTNKKTKEKEKWESEGKDGPPFKKDLKKRQSSPDRKGRDLSDTPEHPADKDDPAYDRTGDYDYSPVEGYGSIQYHYEGKIIHCNDEPMKTTVTDEPEKPASDGMTKDAWRELQWLSEDGSGKKSMPDDFRPEDGGTEAPKSAPPPGGEKQRYFGLASQAAGLAIDPPRLLVLTHEGRTPTLGGKLVPMVSIIPREFDP